MRSPFSIISEVNLEIPYQSVVGMGVYIDDQLEWVEQSLDSVIHQTFKNFLFVIVIDGPLDPDLRSFLVKSAAQADNILLVDAPSNLGLSQCMNFVVEWTLDNLPSTEYFFRMDSDDISLADRFSKQIGFFAQNPTVSVLGTSLIEINEKGKKVGKRMLPTKHNEIERIMPKRCAINHPTVAIRMQVFKDGFRYRPNLKNTQDYFLWAELCANGYKFANLPEILLQFRRVNDFYKRRGIGKSINEFKARFYTMKRLNRYSIGNIIYAFAVLFLRIMPAKLVKLAYKIDRYFLNRRVGHE